jgi:3-oxoacyl-[acyl-carrier protein] reductase
MDKSRGDKVAAEIVAAGGDAAAFVADISSESDVKRIVSEIDTRFGRIDILVNNAAISDNKTIFTITKADWDNVIAVTLTGTFLMCQNVAKLMVDKNIAGKIVNVGSTSGFFGRSRALAYTTAKGGVANFTRSLAVQLAKYNIRVNAIIPNKIGSPVGKDEFDPTRPVVNLVNRPGVPDDLAQAVLFMVSKESGFIAGALLFVDGGMSAMMVGDQE